ncbi:MAG: divalent-cation tolerance protein CutA [Polyangiales bacterium]
MSTEVRVVLCTVPSRDIADRLARTLLEEKLVACVNVLPSVRAIYRWQGAIEEADELLLVLKTARDRSEALEARIRALHPYDVPEVLGLDAAASAPYLAWVVAETR